MKKRLFLLILFSIAMLLIGCSKESEENKSTADQADSSAEKSRAEESNMFTVTDDSESEQQGATTSQEESSDEESTTQQADESTEADRKVIYTANLRIEVKNYQETVDHIQAQVSDRGGYIAESNMREGSEDGSVSGRITVRVPQDKFEEFIQLVEDESSNVLESSTSGQDVTEEYVDLESRLESKRVVEERLLSFMEEAEETEDLLKISDDLGEVQQEIEEITGRMNYLENKVDLATVTINIQENNVSISGDKNLNTWEKTKQQFMKSINFLLSAFSGLFVFIAGSSPVLIILGIIGLVVFWMIRKRKKNHQESSE